MDKELVKSFVDKNYDGMMCLLETLCKIPAPSGCEEKRAKFCKAWLLAKG